MTKKTRTIIFILFIIVFALTAPAVIFYSQGYRIDFANRKVVQTGSLYLKISPKSADVYINGKLIKTTSIFTNSALIENLLPKTYNVEIKKQGFHTWQKTLEVREKQVTESKNVLLIPIDPKFDIFSSDEKEIIQTLSLIESSATSSDGKKVIEANGHELWVYFVQPKNESEMDDSDHRLFLNRFSETIGKVFWLNDYYLIFNVGNKIKVAEIDDRDRINMVDLTDSFDNPEIFWDREKTQLFMLSSNKLYISEPLLP